MPIRREESVIPSARQQSDNARRREERRAADRRASNERWQTILQGAATVFRREGFGRSRLEDVAAEVGINRASLYYYVGTKEELLVELIEQPAHEMTLHCQEALHADIPADDKLRRALRAYVEDLDARPEIFLLFSESQHLANVPGTERIIANAETYGRTLTAIIDEGIASGVFRADLDARLAMLGILGMHNWIHRWYAPDGRKTLREIGDAFTDLALSGVTA